MEFSMIRRPGVRRYEVESVGRTLVILAIDRVEAIVRFFDAEKFTIEETCDASEPYLWHLRTEVRVRNVQSDRTGPWWVYEVIVHDLKPSLPERPDRHVHVLGQTDKEMRE